MKRKILIATTVLFMVSVTLLSGCSELISNITADNEVQQTETQAESMCEYLTEETLATEEPEIEFNTDQKIFLEISIDTKENELQSIADKYGYHLDLTRYNAGESNRDPEENYVYELYDPSQFRNETEENWRSNRKYYGVQVTYYHANDEANTQYIVSCAYSKSGNKLVEQTFDVATRTTEYSYWKQVTTAPAHQDENWHKAVSAEEALIAYLSD